MQLFKKYPVLKENIPYYDIGNYPAPVSKMEGLGKVFSHDTLFLKDDGFTGIEYGGNKVRKLEFLIGEALKSGAKETLTFGFDGSNHALATAVYARKAGLRPISVLMPQVKADYVKKNLLYDLALGSRFERCEGIPEMGKRSREVSAQIKAETGRGPYVISPGGSSPLGTMGYVNAALELAEQIKKGLIPEPDRIYIPLGSMGSAAGLVIGLKAVGVKSKVIAVGVVEPGYANAGTFAELLKSTMRLLRDSAPSFPDIDPVESNYEIRKEFFGQGYAAFTDEGEEAVTLMREKEDIQLEGTYSGKAMAALIADVRAGKCGKENLLFWKTCNSVDFSDKIAGMDYHDLPKAMHGYF